MRLRAGHTNRLRIIGGRWRSRVLRFPEAEGLRPTPDRVRETLFNWLGQDLTGLRCLDLFAGSGALGFEAASRGAGEVVLVERAAASLEALRESARLLDAANVRVTAGDALRFLSDQPGVFDVIFLDPPFASDLLARVLPLAATRLEAHGKIYAESAQPLSPQTLQTLGLRIHRQGRAGQSCYAVLEKIPAD